MSRLTRFGVRPLPQSGWYEVFDRQTNAVYAEVRGKAEANRRCRQANTAYDAPPDRDEIEDRLSAMDEEALAESALRDMVSVRVPVAPHAS